MLIIFKNPFPKFKIAWMKNSFCHDKGNKVSEYVDGPTGRKNLI
jgi:hypothetical protein